MIVLPTYNSHRINLPATSQDGTGNGDRGTITRKISLGRLAAKEGIE